MSALTTAIVAAANTAGLPVGVGKEPTHAANRPWAVIWPDGGMRTSTHLAVGGGYAETWTCHHYGLTPESADVAVRILTDAVHALHLADVGGRRVLLPEQLSAIPMTVDRDADPPLYDLTVEWRLSTTPIT